jgi:hypothetical protein
MSTGLWTGSTGVGSRVHGSIKRQSLATGSMTRNKPSEPLSRLLISTVHHRSDGWGGWLRSGAARAHAHGGSPEFEFSRAMVVGIRWGLLLRDHNDEGNSVRLTLIGGGQQWSPAMVRRLDRCLVTVSVASGEASAPRTCAEGSWSSLPASWPINCSERRRKTWIWWLPRVRRRYI